MQFVPVVGPDHNATAYLETDELEINKDHTLDEFLTFYVHTYNKLSSIKNGPNDPEAALGWQYVFGYVNQFFNTLDNPSKELIVKTYALIKKDINVFQEIGDIYQITSLIKTISGKLAQMDLDIDLCPKLVAFVEQYIPIGLLKDAGNRPQDKPELTFYKHDVIVVTAITVLCKMLCPIFGNIVAITKKSINAQLKEIHCSCVITGIIENRFKNETEKLKHYIEHVTIQIHQKDTADALVYGYDMNSLAHRLYCQLLVRQLVNVNLSVKDSNLMSYIIVSTKRSINTILNSVANTPTKGRTPIAAESEDEGNIAQLETDSMTSRKTSDIDAIVVAAVPRVIQKFMTEYSIEASEYNACLDYYSKFTLTPSPLNEQLNSLIYGADFGGSIGIKMLKFKEYNLITVLTQLILFLHDADPAYKQLAHLVTANPSIATMVLNDELNDNIVWLQVSASNAFKNCKQRFMNSTVAIKNHEWENHIQNIIRDITVNHYVYNTAPWLWEWLGEENQNGKIIQLDKNILVAYCDFYDWFLKVREAAGE